MKKIVVLTLVVGLTLGLLLPTGLSPQSSAAPPQQPTPEGPVLITIVENLTLMPAGDTEGKDVFKSGWMDVSSYRLFRFYAKLTPYVGEAAPVSVRIHESPTGTADEVYGICPADYEWRASPPWDPVQYCIDSPFEGLYSKIRVWARNDSNAPATISLYGLMAKE